MHTMHRGLSIARATRRSIRSNYVCHRCAVQQFHSQQRLHQEEGTAPANNQTPPPTPAKPITRRQGSRMASEMIQGLRFSAPGGFGPKNVQRNTSSSNTEESTSRQPGLSSKRKSLRPGTDRAGRLDRGPTRARSSEVEQNSEKASSREPQNLLVTILRESGDQSEDVKARHLANDKPLVRRFLSGKVVRFADEEEKKRVLALAEELAAEEAKRTGRELKSVSFVPVPKAYKDSVGKEAAAGKYESVQGVKGKTPKELTMSHLKTSLQLNNSYSQVQQQALLGFLNRMWPKQATGQRARS